MIYIHSLLVVASNTCKHRKKYNVSKRKYAAVHMTIYFVSKTLKLTKKKHLVDCHNLTKQGTRLNVILFC